MTVKTFEFNGTTMTASWNGKVYAGKRYINVKSSSMPYSAGTDLVWKDGEGALKHAGMNYWPEIIKLFGLN